MTIYDVIFGKGITSIYNGDCRDVLPTLDLVDAVVTDPPYGLSFMGKGWDRGIPSVEFWEAVMAAMKPGAHLLAFGGTRTFHRLTCAIEDAGFEIRDCLMWVYGSGFPKSLDVSKAIDKAASAEREVVGKAKGIGSNSGESRYNWNNVADAVDRRYYDETISATDDAKDWEGWGTALKPAWEPIVLARKPLEGTVANNVLEHGVGGLNIDGCRVDYSAKDDSRIGKGYTHNAKVGLEIGSKKDNSEGEIQQLHNSQGRWPANLIHDGSEEVVELFPDTKSGALSSKVQRGKFGQQGIYGKSDGSGVGTTYMTSEGSAARFFYCAKASKKERDMGLRDIETHSAGDMTGGRKEGSDGLNSPRAGAGRTQGGHNNHPTVKPIALMQYLCRLITPPGGVVLDPFMGSGSTLVAAQAEGFNSVGIDTEESYCEIARRRCEDNA